MAAVRQPCPGFCRGGQSCWGSRPRLQSRMLCRVRSGSWCVERPRTLALLQPVWAPVCSPLGSCSRRAGLCSLAAAGVFSLVKCGP